MQIIYNKEQCNHVSKKKTLTKGESQEFLQLFSFAEHHRCQNSWATTICEWIQGLEATLFTAMLEDLRILRWSLFLS